MNRPKLSLAILTAIALLRLTPPASAADTGFTIEKTANNGLSVKFNGQPFADYVVDQANKPYLAPVFGPTG
ncbi:MAG: hypothetical protein ABI318_00405, partial [Chthoniobacteraceae bacterium]